MKAKRLALMALGLSLGLLLTACPQTPPPSGGGGGGGGEGGGSTPSFALALNPSSLTVQQGNSTQTTLTITPQNGFTGTVNLSLVPGDTQVPQGLDLSPQSVQVTGPSSVDQPLTISASSSTPTGTYRIKVRATSGSLTKEASLTVAVQAPSGGGGGGGGSGNGATVTVRQLDSTPLVGAYYRVGGGSWQPLSFSNGQATFTATTATGDYEVAVRCQSGPNVPTDIYLFKATVSQATALRFSCENGPTYPRTFEVNLPESIGSYTLQPGDTVAVGNEMKTYTGSNPVSLTAYTTDGTQEVLFTVLRPEGEGGPIPSSVTPIGYKLATLVVGPDAPTTVDATGWQPFSGARNIASLEVPQGYIGGALVYFFRDGMGVISPVGLADRYGLLNVSGKYIGLAQAASAAPNSEGSLLMAVKDTGGNDWTPSLMNPWEAGQFSVNGATFTLAHPQAQMYELTVNNGLVQDAEGGYNLRARIVVYANGSTTYTVPVVPGLRYALEGFASRSVSLDLMAFRGTLAATQVLFSTRVPTEDELAGVDLAWAQRYVYFSGSSYTLP